MARSVNVSRNEDEDHIYCLYRGSDVHTSGATESACSYALHVERRMDGSRKLNQLERMHEEDSLCTTSCCLLYRTNIQPQVNARFVDFKTHPHLLEREPRPESCRIPAPSTRQGRVRMPGRRKAAERAGDVRGDCARVAATTVDIHAKIIFRFFRTRRVKLAPSPVCTASHVSRTVSV